MKKLLLLTLVLFSISSFGQMSFGVKAGLNVNDIILKNTSSSANDYSDLYEVNLGYHVGLYGVINLAEKFSLIPELQFSQKGFHYAADGTEGKVNLNYVELPILLSYSPIESLSIDFGPSFAYKISAVTKSDGSKNNSDNRFEQNFDFGINGGLRFSATKRISVIGRYYYGLVAIEEFVFRDVNNNPDGSLNVYNGSIQMSLSYRIK
jgi:hypothetical protein